RVVAKADEALLGRIHEVSLTLEEGLDFSKEVRLLTKYPIGTCLTYAKDGEVVGFALCYFFAEAVGLYPPCDPENLRIRLLAMDAGRCGQEDLRAFIGACEAYARSIGRRTIVAPIYADYFTSLQTLYRLGSPVH